MSDRPKTFYISKMLLYAASANAHFLDVSAARDEVRDLLAALAERDKMLERIAEEHFPGLPQAQQMWLDTYRVEARAEKGTP